MPCPVQEYTTKGVGKAFVEKSHALTGGKEELYAEEYGSFFCVVKFGGGTW